MSENQIVVRRGVGFLPLLTLLFIGLKLGNVINWSWWWVLAPMWGPLAIIVALAALLGCLMLVIAVIDEFQKRR